MTKPLTLTCVEVRDLAPAFVTGALDADEAAAVREHLAGCDDPHPEMPGLG
ncbi:MAG: zf-HC2 domain-containing protein, partial [Actinomycetota bacterium]